RRLLVAASVLPAMLALTGCRGHHSCVVETSGVAVNPGGNGILEPGEIAEVVPTWGFHNIPSSTGCIDFVPCAPSAPLVLNATSFTGPAPGIYSILDAVATFGSIPLGEDRSCSETGNCFKVQVGQPFGRPATHWDTSFVEDTPGGTPGSWL